MTSFRIDIIVSILKWILVMFSFSFLRFRINLKLPSGFPFKKIGDIISPSSWSHFTMTFFLSSFWISISIISCWAWGQLWVLNSKRISPSNSIGIPDTVAKISWPEVRDLHIGKQDFFLPSWKSSLCCFKLFLRIHTSSCKISKLCCVFCCCSATPVLSIVDWSFVQFFSHDLKKVFSGQLMYNAYCSPKSSFYRGIEKRYCFEIDDKIQFQGLLLGPLRT